MARGRSIRASLTALAALVGCADQGAGPAMPVRHDALPAAALAAGTAGSIPADGLLMVGMDASHVDDLLGRPERVMTAGPAQWWRYTMGKCAIDVFLIAQDPAGTLVVNHVTIGAGPGPGAGTLLAQPCEKLATHLNQAATRSEAPSPELQEH